MFCFGLRDVKWQWEFGVVGFELVECNGICWFVVKVKGYVLENMFMRDEFFGSVIVIEQFQCLRLNNQSMICGRGSMQFVDLFYL